MFATSFSEGRLGSSGDRGSRVREHGTAVDRIVVNFDPAFTPPG
jgi:hypothetical protein